MSTKNDANIKYALAGMGVGAVISAGIAFAMNIGAGGNESISDSRTSLIEERVAAIESNLSSIRQAEFISMSDAKFEDKVETAINNIIRRRAEAEAQAPTSAQGAAPMQGASGYDGNLQVSINGDNNIVYGNPDADISILVFKDFRCSFCKRYVAELNAFVANNESVNWIYKPFPVLGQASVRLAQVGECIALEEGPEAFAQYARQAFQAGDWNRAMQGINLKNTEAVKSCIDTNKYQARLEDVRADARELDITGTPASLFRNNSTGKAAFVPGYIQAHQIAQMIEEVR